MTSPLSSATYSTTGAESTENTTLTSSLTSCTPHQRGRSPFVTTEYGTEPNEIYSPPKDQGLMRRIKERWQPGTCGDPYCRYHAN